MMTWAHYTSRISNDFTPDRMTAHMWFKYIHLLLFLSTAMWIQLSLYVSMGLAIVVMLEEVNGAMHPGAFKLLAAGGVAYLGGIPCFLIGENVGEIA